MRMTLIGSIVHYCYVAIGMLAEEMSMIVELRRTSSSGSAQLPEFALTVLGWSIVIGAATK
jgi:hypothetical protein